MFLVNVIQFSVSRVSVFLPNVTLWSVNELTVALQVFVLMDVILLSVSLLNIILLKITAPCKHITESPSQLCEEMSRTVVSLLNLK
jgi:hypothetical protein